MTSRVILGCLIVHLATFIGAIIAGLDVGNCERSTDLLCGTPVEGFIHSSSGVQASANPFRVGAALMKLLGVLGKLTWYNYEVLNASTNTLANLYYFVVQAAFAAIWLFTIWKAGSVMAQAVGRFFTR